MARPRVEDVLEEERDCPKHGRQAFRRHRNGRRANGKVKWIWRCMPCQAGHASAWYHSNKRS